MKNKSSQSIPAHTLIIVLLFTVFFQFCKSSQVTIPQEVEEVVVKEKLVSYETDLLPIMKRSCTPCHFPEKGKVKFLDTYESTKESINYIIYRVELPVEDEEYMPFKSKRQALSPEETQLFKDWKAQGMGE